MNLTKVFRVSILKFFIEIVQKYELISFDPSLRGDSSCSMKKKIVRLPTLARLSVEQKNPNQGVGPCALELSAVLNCWSNSRDAAPDAAECQNFVNTLTKCMRSWVSRLL